MTNKIKLCPKKTKTYHECFYYFIEQVKSLTQFAVDLGFLVEEYAASRGTIPPRKRRKKKSVYVATIEKVGVCLLLFYK